MTQFKLPNENWYLPLVCLLAFIVVLPIAYFGIPNTYDMPQHFRFAEAFYNSIMKGDFFPGWAGDENFGYGDLGIRFYPPLAYYVLAFLRILTGNWFDATWLSFALWMILGCAGIYSLASCWLAPKESAIAALFYLFIPFHLHQLYTGFNQFSELASSSILTFCLFFLTRIFQRGKAFDVLGFACAYAILILTHLPAGVIGSLSLFVYAVLLSGKGNFVRPMVKSGIAVALGLAASSFYWIVLVTELNWVNHASEKFSRGFYDFSKHFYPTLYFSKDSSEATANLAMIDVLIALTFLFLCSSVVFFLYKRKNASESFPEKNIFQTILPLGLFASLMFTPLSYPLWRIITPLQKAQFPVRWMPVVAVCGAVVASAAMRYLLKGDFLKSRGWIYACVFMCSSVLLFDLTYIFQPSSFVPIERARFENDLRALPETESFDCWWTIWSDRKAFDEKEKVIVGNRAVEIASWQPENKVFQISEGGDAAARIATFYYPHWQARVNGKPVEIGKDQTGAMLIPVPAEKSSVEITFREPAAVTAASFASLFVWLFLTTVGLYLAAVKIFSKQEIFKSLEETEAIRETYFR